ncbi:MAG: hypothetical protein AAB556_00580, partial [Patescibacteria group bacterium]
WGNSACRAQRVPFGYFQTDTVSWRVVIIAKRIPHDLFFEQFLRTCQHFILLHLNQKGEGVPKVLHISCV